MPRAEHFLKRIGRVKVIRAQSTQRVRAGGSGVPSGPGLPERMIHGAGDDAALGLKLARFGLPSGFPHRKKIRRRGVAEGEIQS